MGENYEQSKSSKYCCGLQALVLSRTFSIFSAENICSESTRGQNYTGRDRYSFRKRGNRAYSSRAHTSKVCIKSLPGEEEIGRVQACDKSQEFKSVHSHRTLYNGDYYKPKNNVFRDRLDCDNRYFRCLSHYSSGRGIQGLCSFPISGSDLPIPVYAFRPKRKP